MFTKFTPLKIDALPNSVHIVGNATDEINKPIELDLSIPIGELSIDRIKVEVRKQFHEKIDIDTLIKGLLSAGDISLIEPNISPTEADIWRSNYSKLNLLDDLMFKGIITGNEKEYTNLLQLTKDTFKFEYVL